MRRKLDCGDVLCSPVSTARFVVIDGCGAADMPSVDGVPLEYGKPPCCGTPAMGRELPLRGGQRYVDALTGLSLMCVYPGLGVLEYDARPLTPAPPRRPLSSPITSHDQTAAAAYQIATRCGDTERHAFADSLFNAHSDDRIAGVGVDEGFPVVADTESPAHRMPRSRAAGDCAGRFA